MQMYHKIANSPNIDYENIGFFNIKKSNCYKTESPGAMRRGFKCICFCRWNTLFLTLEQSVFNAETRCFKR